MREFKGTLASSPAKLADALELGGDLEDLSRTYVYASMMSDEDTRVSNYQGMQQEMVQLGADLGAETAVHGAGDPEDRRRRARHVRWRRSRG